MTKSTIYYIVLSYWLDFFTLLVIFLAPLSPQVWPYALFMVPLNYFAVARADYLIHRNGHKMAAVEFVFDFYGNQRLQNLGSSAIAIFDIPLFIGVAILGKVWSPYPLSDSSPISVGYWVACAVSGLFVWLATKMAKRHFREYESVLRFRYGKKEES